MSAAFALWTGNRLHPGAAGVCLEELTRAAAAERCSVESYLHALVAGEYPAGRQALIDRLIVGTSWFLREQEGLAALVRALGTLARARATRAVSVWSVGCSTGEEPYSLAMLLLEAGLEPLVLATDVRAAARAYAERGEYPQARLSRMPPAWSSRYFEPAGAGQVRVVPALRACVRFGVHNLVARAETPPLAGPFDAVVCRNVFIYFERMEAARALSRLAGFCRPEGRFLLGAAERPLFWMIGSFVPDEAEPSLYRRAGTTEPRGRAPVAATAPVPAPPAEPALLEARRLIRGGRMNEAVACLTLSLERDPLQGPANLLLGMALKSQGRLDQAIQPLRNARFLLHDESWLAPYLLAACLEQREDRPGAREAYAHAMLVLRANGPSGLGPAEDDEAALATTVLAGCERRLRALSRGLR